MEKPSILSDVEKLKIDDNLLEAIKKAKDSIATFLSQIHSGELTAEEVRQKYSEVSMDVSESGVGHSEEKVIKKIYEDLYSEIRAYLGKKVAQEMESSHVDISDLPTEQVEARANYEGNQANLMLERVSNSEIRQQLIELIYLDRKYSLGSDSVPGAKDIEKIEDELIKKVGASTPIRFSGEMPATDGVREFVTLNWRCPPHMGEFGTLQKGITEAHEKGHIVRKLTSGAMMWYFGRVIDLSAIKISKEMIEYDQEMTRREKKDDSIIVTEEKVREAVYSYLSDPAEIIERMSQLKNYFGMSGGEKFTLSHLRYAREHYINDTKCNNNMSEFFQAITPETEQAFIELINICGV